MSTSCLKWLIKFFFFFFCLSSIWVTQSLLNVFNKFLTMCVTIYRRIIDVLTIAMHIQLVIKIFKHLNKCEWLMIAESLSNIFYMRYLSHHNHVNFFFDFFFDNYTCINYKCSLITFKFSLFYISLSFHTNVWKILCHEWSAHKLINNNWTKILIMLNKLNTCNKINIKSVKTLKRVNVDDVKAALKSWHYFSF